MIEDLKGRTSFQFSPLGSWSQQIYCIFLLICIHFIFCCWVRMYYLELCISLFVHNFMNQVSVNSVYTIIFGSISCYFERKVLNWRFAINNWVDALDKTCPIHLLFLTSARDLKTKDCVHILSSETLSNNTIDS